MTEEFERRGLAGITVWLADRHGGLIFACVKAKLAGRRNAESHEDLFNEALFGCARWIERDLIGRPSGLLAMPVKRLVLCKTSRIVARWLRRESSWCRVESLDSNPGISANLLASKDVDREGELFPHEAGDADWSDKDVDEVCECLDLSKHERAVLEAHLALQRECLDKHIKYTKRGYRQVLADKLSDDDRKIKVTYVARHLKSVRAKCREYYGGSRRRFIDEGDSDGPSKQARLERGSPGSQPEGPIRIAPTEGGTEQ